jgi:hypothetical protein
MILLTEYMYNICMNQICEIPYKNLFVTYLYEQ